MAYPLDVAAQNAALDALLGRDVSGVPTAWEVALFDLHPEEGGVELSADGGYARGSLSNDTTDLPAASDGLKTSVVVDFGTSTDAYSDTASYAVLFDAADSTTRWFAVPLGQEVDVPAAGVPVKVRLSSFWNTES